MFARNETGATNLWSADIARNISFSLGFPSFQCFTRITFKTPSTYCIQVAIANRTNPKSRPWIRGTTVHDFFKPFFLQLLVPQKRYGTRKNKVLLIYLLLVSTAILNDSLSIFCFRDNHRRRKIYRHSHTQSLSDVIWSAT